MKKLDKVLSIVLIALMLSCIALNVFADVNIDNIKASGTSSDSAMENVGKVIISYVTSAAMVIAVVMVAILGIKYMMGSVEEKAEYKKTLIPLLVGAVLVFGASAIAKIIIGLAGSFSGQNG